MIYLDKITQCMNISPGKHNDLHVDIGLKEGVYKLFSFHGIHIWNHISKKISIDVSYACFKNLSKNFI